MIAFITGKSETGEVYLYSWFYLSHTLAGKFHVRWSLSKLNSTFFLLINVVMWYWDMRLIGWYCDLIGRCCNVLGLSLLSFEVKAVYITIGINNTINLKLLSVIEPIIRMGIHNGIRNIIDIYYFCADCALL